MRGVGGEGGEGEEVRRLITPLSSSVSNRARSSGLRFFRAIMFFKGLGVVPFLLACKPEEKEGSVSPAAPSTGLELCELRI